jgi:hypothetical protein
MNTGLVKPDAGTSDARCTIAAHEDLETGNRFAGSPPENPLRRGDTVRPWSDPLPGRCPGPTASTDRGDLDDPEALVRAAEGVDVIYHVAGLVMARDEAEFHAVNAEGTRRLLEAAAPSGARFVLVSSLAAGGPTVPGRPLLGHEPPHPVTAYGRSKLAAEAVVRAGPLPWTIVRPPAVYGPRDREMFRSSARQVLSSVKASGTVPAFAPTWQTRSPPPASPSRRLADSRPSGGHYGRAPGAPRRRFGRASVLKIPCRDEPRCTSPAWRPGEPPRSDRRQGQRTFQPA